MTGPIAPIDYTSDAGRVRLLATDVNVNDPLFTGPQIDAFLALAGGNVKRAAARALDTIAVSEVLVSKKIRTQDLNTDGPAVAKALREQAQALRDEADTDDDNDGWSFEVVPGPGATSYGPELTERPSTFGWL